MVLNWLRRRLGPDRETLDLLADLEHQVHDLESQKSDMSALLDEMSTLLGRSEQRVSGLRGNNEQLKKAMRAAYEPVEVGECTKVRYTREDDAAEHAVQIAIKLPGTAYNAYQCRRCPPYVLTGERPWHAGSCREDDFAAVRYWDRTLQYGCGCVFTADTQEWAWHCDAHRTA